MSESRRLKGQMHVVGHLSDSWLRNPCREIGGDSFSRDGDGLPNGLAFDVAAVSMQVQPRSSVPTSRLGLSRGRTSPTFVWPHSTLTPLRGPPSASRSQDTQHEVAAGCCVCGALQGRGAVIPEARKNRAHPSILYVHAQISRLEVP